MFVLGGITHNELVRIENLQKENFSSQIIVGASHIISPLQYLKDLEEVSPDALDLSFDSGDEENMGSPQKPLKTSAKLWSKKGDKSASNIENVNDSLDAKDIKVHLDDD